MVEIPASRFSAAELSYFLPNQRLMSPAQAKTAREHPHLIWINPPPKNIPRALRMAVFERDGGKCAYCPAVLTVDDFTVDHKHPRSKGGTDDIDNLTVACRPCNSRKKDRA